MSGWVSAGLNRSISVLSAHLTAWFLRRWTFVVLVVFSTLLYLGGGALYNMQQGNPFSFPHVRFWNNVYALVLDGIHFVSSGGKPAPASTGSGGYAPVPVIVGPKATVSGGTTCVRYLPTIPRTLWIAPQVMLLSRQLKSLCMVVSV